jgi:hypothetical protein
VGTGQINSPASSGSTEQHAPLSEPQCRATLPTSRPAIAAPPADFDHKSPLPPQPTADQLDQEVPLQAPHSASCVFTERVNNGAYHLQPSMNCGDTAPTTSNTYPPEKPHTGQLTGINYWFWWTYAWQRVSTATSPMQSPAPNFPPIILRSSSHSQPKQFFAYPNPDPATRRQIGMLSATFSMRDYY